jgi:hypothetical protein
MQPRKSHEAYHGPDEPDDGTCPFCNRPARMGADSPATCAMCAMEIHHPDEAVTVEGQSGQTLYFCCIWCQRIYQRAVIREAHEAIEAVGYRDKE